MLCNNTFKLTGDVFKMTLEELRQEIKSWVRNDFDKLVDFLNLRLEQPEREISGAVVMYKYKLDGNENILVSIHKTYGTMCFLESCGKTVRLNIKTLELKT